MPSTKAKKPTTKARPKKAEPAGASGNNQVQSEDPPAAETTGYSAGDLVSHPQFGEGTVTAIEGNKLTIKFIDGRVKQIVDYYLKRRER